MPTWDEYITDKKTYPDETKITLESGVETTLGQLRSGYMKDSDYRQKTSNLARQREEFDRDYLARMSALETAQTRLQEIAENVSRSKPEATPDEVDQVLRENPAARRLMEKIQRIESVLEPIAGTLVDLDKRQKDSQLNATAEQHRAMLNQLKAFHKTTFDEDLDEGALIQHAKNTLVPRLDIAYLSLNHNRLSEHKSKKAAEEADKKGYERAKKELGSPVIPLRRVFTPQPTDPKNMEDAATQALQDPEVMNPLLGIE